MSAGAATQREIDSQPECWRRAARMAAEQASILPPQGARVAAAGCGTSLYVAQSYAAGREAAGHGETDAFPASELPAGRRYDALVVVSRSGTTTEVARLLERGTGARRTIAIVADASSPVARLADGVVELAFADEQSVVQTRFATSALALLRAHLGDDVDALAEQASAALQSSLPVVVNHYEHFVFLGSGAAVGLAAEAALKLREAAGAFTESYPAMEYRHGPISVAGPRTLVWVLGPLLGEGLAALADDIRATGATVVTSEADALPALVLAQRAAVALAQSRGLDPDAPRNLTRSVVL
jgi:fructoselysine-6-P-deglycase FrlB-like protein